MLLFKPEHVRPILSKLKTQTRRIWTTRRVKPGSNQKCKLKMMSRNYFALIRILEVYQERLGDISPVDAIAEGYSSPEAFFEEWREINGKVDLDLVVWVVRFELVAGVGELYIADKC